jgi:hypothetical protein
MRRLLAGVLLSVLSLLVSPNADVAGANDEALIRLLIKKGILTQEEYEVLKKEAETPVPPPAVAGRAPEVLPTQPPRAEVFGQPPAALATPDPSIAELVDRLRDEVRGELRRRDTESIAVGLKLESESRFRTRRDIGDRRSGSSSETYIRAFEVNLAAKPIPWILASLVVKSEYVGADSTNQGQPADAAPFVDEGSITLKSPEFPLYAVVGKRTQPFGAFFGTERWVTDPMSKDAYEVNQPGLTAGVFRKFYDTGLEFDLSATVYRQEEQVDHLFESGLFDSKAVVRSTAVRLRTEQDQLTSFIGTTTLTPNRFFTLGAAYLTEPGDGRRNQSLAAWASRTWFARLTTELEFMAALARERYIRQTTRDDGMQVSERLPQSFDEKVLAVGLTYQLSRNFLIGGRYEHFWDGGLADGAGIWSLRHRGSLAASYTLFERGAISTRIIGEYRFSDIRHSGTARGTAGPDQNELFGKLSVVYK